MSEKLTLKDRKKLVFVSIFVCFLFCALIVQFFKIQIIEGEKWSKRAKAQHQLILVEPFKRGLFYSNTAIKPGHPDQMVPFVVDVPQFHLYVDPLAIPEIWRSEIADRLVFFLTLEKEAHQKFRSQFFKKSHHRKLAMWLSEERRSKIINWWEAFAKKRKIPSNALFFIQDYKRSYPFGSLLGQVLHTVRGEKEALTQDSIPTGGLELIFNQYLKGKVGKKLLLRSPRHPLDVGHVVSPPENGADVYLTINHYLQAVAEEEIAKAVKKSNARGGWAIIMEPRSGEILALAQYPYFDPASYQKYFNDPLLSEDTKVKAGTDPYEPGSTMKPLTLVICLKANAELKKRGKKPIYFPEEKIATADGRFPGRKKPISDTHLHRYLNMPLAMQKSSNIYMARMVQRVIEALGETWYRNALQEIFGFGIKTGLELPAESSGMLPCPGKKHPNGTLEWSTATPFSVSFGHNILVTSLQMLRSYAILANGGYDVVPTLVRKIVKTHPDGTQEILLDHTRQERIQGFKRVLEKEIVEDVIDVMKLVTKPGGSASKADIYGYTEAGKTATSEKIVNGTYSKKDHISTFVGFAPAHDARFVLLIAIDDPEFKYIPGVGRNQLGGNCAAPAFREIGTRVLQYLGVEPDDPHGYPAGDPRHDPQKADSLKRVQELKELYKKWNSQ